MIRARVLLALIWLGLSGSLVSAQRLFVPQGSGDLVTLTPADASGNPTILFAEQAGQPQPALTAPTPVVVSRGIFGNRGVLDIGFDYLRPFGSFRDYAIALPDAYAGGFPVIGDVDHVDTAFGFVPRMRYNVWIDDQTIGFAGSGMVLNLSGNLARQISDAVTTGALTANSKLSITSAVFPELNGRIYAGDWLPSDHPWLRDLIVDLGIGTRYAHVNQTFTSRLVSGANNTAIREASQDYQGLGAAITLNFTLPCRTNFACFANTRGSMVVGDNVRNASLNINAAGLPPLTSVLTESKTAFVPIGELETGVIWGFQLADRLRRAQAGPLLTIRAGLVGQIWGDLGLPAAASTQGFRHSDLFLVGANLTAGLTH